MKRSRFIVDRKNRHQWPPLILVAVVGSLICVVLMIFIKMINPPNRLCANTKSCQSDLSEQIDNGVAGIFQGHVVAVPNIDPVADQSLIVLGSSDPEAQKHIYVDLSLQKLYAYEDQDLKFETWVSTGRWGRTPTGNFNIWLKLRSTRMAGGSGTDAYDLPNVPHVMFFYHDFGLHGAYWHNNFGYTMSHGCVNLRQIDAQFLYNWTDGPEKGSLGTPVSVCDHFVGPDYCEQLSPIKL
jgi:hypothetical protein